MKPQYNKQEGGSEGGVRENLALEFQINEQIREYRRAVNIGDIAASSRALTCLKSMLWSKFGKARMAGYNKVDAEFRQKSYEEFYTDDDKADLRYYDELEPSRIRDLKQKAAQENRIAYGRANEKKFNIIMGVIDDKGLGLRTGLDAEIDHDKKKLAPMGRLSSTRSAATSSLK